MDSRNQNGDETELDVEFSSNSIDGMKRYTGYPTNHCTEFYVLEKTHFLLI